MSYAWQEGEGSQRWRATGRAAALHVQVVQVGHATQRIIQLRGCGPQHIHQLELLKGQPLQQGDAAQLEAARPARIE